MQKELQFFEENKNIIESLRSEKEIIEFFKANNFFVDKNFLKQIKLKYNISNNSTKLNNSQLEKVAGGVLGGRGRSLEKGSPAERRSRSADPRLEQHICEDLPGCPSAYLGTWRPRYIRTIPCEVLVNAKNSTEQFRIKLNNDDCQTNLNEPLNFEQLPVTSTPLNRHRNISSIDLNPHHKKRAKLSSNNPTPQTTPLTKAVIPDLTDPKNPLSHMYLDPFEYEGVYPLPPTPMKSRMPVPTVNKNLECLDLAISPLQVITYVLPQTVPSSPVIRDEEVPSSPNFT